MPDSIIIYATVFWVEDEKEEISSYWMTLQKKEHTENWNRRHLIALSGELALEQAIWTCRQTRLCDDDDEDSEW